MKKGNLIYTRFDHNGNKKISIAGDFLFGFNVASFDNEKQLKKFLKKIGVKAVLHEDGHYYTNKCIDDSCHYGYGMSLPKKCKKIWSLSNGSIVPNYVLQNKKDNSVSIFRLNPNDPMYKKKSLSTEKHIKFQKKFGIY